MMTQTSLSGAALQYRGGPPWCTPPAYPEVRRGFPEGKGFIPSINDRTIVPPPPAQPHSRSPFPATSHPPLATEVLIANLELEFHLTHRKLSPLRISNRKFSPIFRLTPQFRRPSLMPSSGRGLIPSENDRGIVSPPFACPEPRRAQPHPRKPFLVTGHSPLVTAVLIHGSAIKTPRNPFRNNNLKNSNRRQTLALGDDFRATIRRTPAPSTTVLRRFTRAGFWCAA